MQTMRQSGFARDEIDSLGRVSIPQQSLYGSNTARALENFPIDDKALPFKQKVLLVEIPGVLFPLYH